MLFIPGLQGIVGPRKASLSLFSILLFHSLNCVPLLGHVKALVPMVVILFLHICSRSSSSDPVNAQDSILDIVFLHILNCLKLGSCGKAPDGILEIEHLHMLNSFTRGGRKFTGRVLKLLRQMSTTVASVGISGSSESDHAENLPSL